MTTIGNDDIEPVDEPGLVLDLSAEVEVDLTQADFQKLGRATVYLPLSSFGSSNSHIDLAADLLDACWALERLSACAQRLEATIGSGYYKPKIEVVLHGLGPAIRETLIDCALVFLEDEFDTDQTDRIQSLRDEIADFEDVLHTINPAVPEIVDWYFGNLISSYGEWKSESPEYYLDQVRRFPERRVSYFRSAYSYLLGGHCYTSEKGWIMSSSIDVDEFFIKTGQSYRLNDFLPAKFTAIDGQTILFVDGMLVGFPIAEYLKSQVAAALATQDDEDEYFSTAFTLTAGELTLVQNGAIVQNLPGKAEQVTRSGCFVHETGTLMLIENCRFRHLIYDTTPLNLIAAKRIYDAAIGTAPVLLNAVGICEEQHCDWSSLSDDAFEELCYDLIYVNPKFDSATIRKLGKSRSRDGGRDIEVYEYSTWRETSPTKWIFQCKLIRSKVSLGAAKLADVGDMLEQYDAGGFGVMTSAPIDATLYDKLDAICKRRNVKQYHFSVLELERALARHVGIKKRHFQH